jgi:hypothetical protein
MLRDLAAAFVPTRLDLVNLVLWGALTLFVSLILGVLWLVTSGVCALLERRRERRVPPADVISLTAARRAQLDAAVTIGDHRHDR